MRKLDSHDRAITGIVQELGARSANVQVPGMVPVQGMPPAVQAPPGTQFIPTPPPDAGQSALAQILQAVAPQIISKIMGGGAAGGDAALATVEKQAATLANIAQAYNIIRGQSLWDKLAERVAVRALMKSGFLEPSEMVEAGKQLTADMAAQKVSQ